MATHANCAHAATSSARAACRRSGGPGIDAPASTAKTSRSRRVEVTDDNYLEIARAVSERCGCPWPNDEERASSLTKVWCTTCHLLHDADDPCSGVARRATTPEFVEPRPRMRGDDLLPTFSNARALADGIPEGRYALVQGDGTVKFYKIDKPMQGRWAGYVFLKVQASDEFHPVKLAASQMSVYSGIHDMGVKESSALYGHTLGSCGVCGRTLTDAESIARGIGPTCAAKHGW